MDHHVYFWLNEDRKNPADLACFEQALDALCNIPLMLAGRWAVPAVVTPRPVCDQSWDYALDMKFTSVEQHDEYQNHLEHQDFINTYKSWWSKVLVTDLA